MTKLIVVSDTHGSSKGLDKLRPIIAENDIVVHLGDGAGDMRSITADYPEKAYVCAGNCDFFSPYPTEGVLEVEWLKILYCHGHKYGVKQNLYRLYEEAKARGCQIALYGHTHNAMITEIDGVTLINPGSFRFPTGEGGSYAYIVINKDKFTSVIVGESVY